MKTGSRSEYRHRNESFYDRPPPVESHVRQLSDMDKRDRMKRMLIAGDISDLEPVFSSDGTYALLFSNRPLSGTEPKDFDVWKVTRNGEWLE